MILRFTYLPPDWMPYEVKFYQRRLERMRPIKKAKMPAMPMFPANITNPYRL